MLTYEGGPDTSCFFANPSSVPGKMMANLDPRMKQLTYEYLAGHAAHGQHYGALNWFVCCSSSYDFIYGQWGISNSLANFSLAPKWLGIQQALEAPMPVPTLGVPVPGLVDAATDAVSVGRPTSHGFCGKVDELYVLNTLKGGQYTLTFNGTGFGFNVTLTVGIHGETFGTVRLCVFPPLLLCLSCLLCLRTVGCVLCTTRLSEQPLFTTFKVMIDAA